MSPLIRGGLFVVGFAGAVGLGVAIKPTPKQVAAADPKPTVVVNLPPTPTSTILLPPKIESASELVIPPPPAHKSADEPVNKNDMAYKLIEKEMGIKTTLSDEPIVQTRGSVPSSAPATVPPSPPAAAGDSAPPATPRIDLELPSAPATEPMPRLDPIPAPPSLDIPRIQDAAPQPVPPPSVILNTRAISFNFEVTKVGPSKVKAVELWAIRDGHSWQKYDRRAGGQSPFHSHFGGEGQYGFKLVFESESGMRTPEPGPATKPDLQAELDLSPPVVRMNPFLAGPEGTVSIRWTMTDKNLATDRTRIEYSPDGRAWHPISRGQGIGREERSTTGNYHFHWRTPNDLPHQLHVRVTAVDLAGNESSATLPQPSSIDLIVPDGKLTGVATRRGTETGPMPRVVEARQIFSFYFGLFSANTVPAPNPDLQIPSREPAPDRGPNPIQHLREWAQAITGTDPATPPTRAVGFARSMISGCIPIYSDGPGFLMPGELDRLFCLLHWPMGEAISPVERLRMWESPFGYRKSWLEDYPDPSELRSYRDRVECNRQIADTLSGEPSLVSAILEPDWAPSTAKPLPGRPWVVKTGMGLGFEW